MGHSHADELLAAEHLCSQFSGTLIRNFVKQMGHDVTLGDYGAVASAIAPHLTTTERFKIVVDTTFGPNRGQTVCDRRLFAEDAPDTIHALAPYVEVVMDIDIDSMRNMWLETISGH